MWMPGGKILRRIGDRSYDVETGGGIFPRNRRFLRPANDPSRPESDHEAAPEIPDGQIIRNIPRRSARIRANRRVTFAPDTKKQD